MHYISIIIPAKNEARNIGRCLDSLFRLDYPKEFFEVIVVDNGSSDETVAIARSLGATVLVDDKRNISGLRNLGASAAKGDLLAFIDADCEAESQWLENAVPHFCDPSVGGVGAMAVLPGESTWVQRAWSSFRVRHKGVCEVSWLNSMNLVVPAAVYREVNGFDETLVTCEDVDLCYRVSARYRIFSDDRLRVIHHGEAPTIAVFFYKELWRGQSNAQKIMSLNIDRKELVSLCIPLYFLVSLLLLCITQSPAAFAIFFLPSVVFSLQCTFRSRSLRHCLSLFILYNVYATARTTALFYKTSR